MPTVPMRCRRRSPHAMRARARPRTPTGTRIAALYDRLREAMPSPVVELNRAVAHSMAFGPEAGLELIDAIASDAALRNYAPLPAARRATSCYRAGRLEEAREAFEAAVELTRNERERAFLLPAQPPALPGAVSRSAPTGAASPRGSSRSAANASARQAWRHGRRPFSDHKLQLRLTSRNVTSPVASFTRNFEAAVVERAVLGGRAWRCTRRSAPRPCRPRTVERVLGAAVDEVALLVIGAQVARVGLAEDHLRQDHRIADRDHRDLDVAADQKRLDDRVMPLVVELGDGGLTPAQSVASRTPQLAELGVGLDHPALGRRAGGFGRPAPPAIDRPRRGPARPRAGAARLASALSSLSPRRIGLAPTNGNPSRAHSSGQQHLRVEEAGAVEKGKDEIDVGPFEQRLVAVGELKVEPELLEDACGSRRW